MRRLQPLSRRSHDSTRTAGRLMGTSSPARFSRDLAVLLDRPFSSVLLACALLAAACSTSTDLTAVPAATVPPATVAPVLTSISPTTAPPTSAAPVTTMAPTTVAPATTAAPTTVAPTTMAPPATILASTTTMADVPGALLSSEPVDIGDLGVAWRVTYRSTSVAGDPIEVTGTIAAPAGDAPGPRPVLSVAHGTTTVDATEIA